MFVRNEVLAQQKQLNDQSKIRVGSAYVMTENLVRVTDTNEHFHVGDYLFKKLRIEQAQPGYEALNGQYVYVSRRPFCRRTV